MFLHLCIDHRTTVRQCSASGSTEFVAPAVACAHCARSEAAPTTPNLEHTALGPNMRLRQHCVVERVMSFVQQRLLRLVQCGREVQALVQEAAKRCGACTSLATPLLHICQYLHWYVHRARPSGWQQGFL